MSSYNHQSHHLLHSQMFWLLSLLLLTVTSAQSFDWWTRVIDGSGSEIAQSVSISPNGNIAVAGESTSSIASIFKDDGTEVANYVSSANFNWLAVFDQSGALVWTSHTNCNNRYCGESRVAFDQSGNLVFAGLSFGITTTILVSGIPVTTIQGGDGREFAFAVVFSSTGVFKHTIYTMNGGRSFIGGIATGPDNSFAISFHFNNLPLYVNDGLGIQSSPLSSSGGYDAGVCVFAGNGSLMWCSSFGGPDMEGYTKVAMDSQGNVGLTGLIWSPSIQIFGSQNRTVNVTTTVPNLAIKFSAHGSVIFAMTMSPGNIYDIAFTRSGNMVFLGIFYWLTTLSHANGTVIVPSFNYMAGWASAVVIIDPFGVLINYWRLDGAADDIIRAISIDSNDNIIVSGVTQSSTAFVYDPSNRLVGGAVGPGTFSVTLSSSPLALRINSSSSEFKKTASSAQVPLCAAGYFGSSITMYLNETFIAQKTTSNNAALIACFRPRVSTSRNFVSTKVRSTISSSLSVGIGDSKGNSSGAEEVPLVFLISIAAAFLIIMFIITLALRRHRNRLTKATMRKKVAPGSITSDQHVTHDATKKETVTPGSGSATFTDESGFTKTYVQNNDEISIPAFLELEFAKHFMQGEFLAKGGGSSVHKCLSLHNGLDMRRNGADIVVKTFHDDFRQYSTKTVAFWQEIAIMWKFRNYDSFCKVFGYSSSPMSIVMKYYRLGDLESFISGKSPATPLFKYTKREITSLLGQLCRAIGIMHMNDIAHCDVKPSNCLLDSDGLSLKLVLSDFGICRILSGSKQVEAFVFSDLKGLSAYYAAPEVWVRLRGLDKRPPTSAVKNADIYAIGVTCLELLERRRPWRHPRNRH